MKKQILHEGSKLCYRVYGQGRPVILVHGFGEEANVWDGLITHLKDRYQLIVPDLPGSGESALIPDMSMTGMAETIHTIVHEERLNTCTLIGHSMGGYITLAFQRKILESPGCIWTFSFQFLSDSEEEKSNPSARGLPLSGMVPLNF